jgi:hypothetical protein
MAQAMKQAIVAGAGHTFGRVNEHRRAEYGDLSGYFASAL